MDCLCRAAIRPVERSHLPILTRFAAASSTLALLCAVLLVAGGCSTIKIEPPSLGVSSCLTCGINDRP
jgi:hypothetical protein